MFVYFVICSVDSKQRQADPAHLAAAAVAAAAAELQQKHRSEYCIYPIHLNRSKHFMLVLSHNLAAAVAAAAASAAAALAAAVAAYLLL